MKDNDHQIYYEAVELTTKSWQDMKDFYEKLAIKEQKELHQRTSLIINADEIKLNSNI